MNATGRPAAPDLTGRVALVTGASKGIGRAYVLALAGAGATVVAVARSGGAQPGSPGTTLDDLREEAKAQGLGAAVHTVPADLIRDSEVARVAAEARRLAGPPDILVNNAGLYPHYDTLAVRTADWDEVMNLNVRTPYLLVRELVPSMVASRRGSIVNITSRTARTTEAGTAGHDELMVYGVSKAALDRLTTFLAEDLRTSNVAVNGLSPGGVLTATWRAADPEAWEAARASGNGKPATPEVMGPALLHLAAQDATGITGQLLHTDTFGHTWP